MYSTLLTKIASTLNKVDEIAEHFNYPKTKIDSYPAVYYQPAGLINTFETTTQNKKVYRFLMLVIVNVAGNDAEGNPITTDDVFGTILPGVVDSVIAQFDADWDQGNIGGSRVTAKLDSADQWEVSEEQDGIVCYAPLNLEIDVLTTN